MSRGIFASGTASSAELSDCFDMPRARIYSTSPVTLTSGLDTAVPFTSVRWDSHGMWDVGDPTKFVVQSGDDGYYRFGYNLRFANNATGTRRVGIWVNGTDRFWHSIDPACSGIPTVKGAAGIEWPLAVGDYVELFAYQDSGGNLDLEVASAYSLEFWISWFAVS